MILDSLRKRQYECISAFSEAVSIIFGLCLLFLIIYNILLTTNIILYVHYKGLAKNYKRMVFVFSNLF